MKPVDELLKSLDLPNVTELNIISGRRPAARAGNSLDPIDDKPLANDDILRMLVALGGSRYVEDLTSQPKQWNTRVMGFGSVTVSALKRGHELQVKLTVFKRDPRPEPKHEPKVDPKAEPKSAPKLDAKEEQKPRRFDPRSDPSEEEEAPRKDLRSDPREEAPRKDLRSDPREEAPRRDLRSDPREEAPRKDLRSDPREETPRRDLRSDPRDESSRKDPRSDSPLASPPRKMSRPDLREEREEPNLSSPPDSMPTPETPPARMHTPPPRGPQRSASAVTPLERPAAMSMAKPPIAESSPAPARAPSPAPQISPPPSPTPSAPAADHAKVPAPAPTPAGAAPIAFAATVAVQQMTAASHGASLPSAPLVTLSLPTITQAEAAEGEATLSLLLATARAKNASDLHVIAGRPPLFRVAGALLPDGSPIAPKKVEAIAIPRVPQRLLPVLAAEGSCDFAYQSAQHGRFRVNVARHLGGYKACMRVISRELPTAQSLGLAPGILAATHHHQGLVLFTGPTGHGKTTTLTAVVDAMNANTTHHIITVEDPVEHVQPKKKAMISQREVGTHTRTFASALKGSLREDPDVIVVGELRDVETVRMAIAASETGHLVLGTMNTPSAAKTIDRLIDLFPPEDQPQIRLTLAASLRLIVSQRLVPSIDRSRVHAAFEILPASGALAALIRDNKTFQIPSLQQRGKALGIVRLDESLSELVLTKRASIDEGRNFSESPKDFEALVLRGGQ